MSPEQQRDRQEYEEAVKATANTHNLLAISGVPIHTLLAAEGACISVVFGNLIRDYPESGPAMLESWIAGVRRMVRLEV